MNKKIFWLSTAMLGWLGGTMGGGWYVFFLAGCIFTSSAIYMELSNNK